MKTGAALLAGALLLLVPAITPSADPAPGATSACTEEPGSSINMSARVLNLAQGNGSVNALVELRVWGIEAVPAGRITAAAKTRKGRVTDLDLPARRVSLPGRSSLRLRYQVALAAGEDVVLMFRLHDEDSPALPDMASTSLALNLDPATQPEQIDDRLQYRALTPAEVD